MTTTAQTTETIMTEPATVHPFEAHGLGKAPFRLVGMSEAVYQACPGGPTQAAGSCDYCGTGIRHQCHIQSADGREFKVGTDCVMKLDRADNRLVGEVKVAQRAAQKAARRAKATAKRQAEWEAKRPEREAYAAEVARLRAAQEANEAARRDAMTARNGWLIDVLEAASHREDDFCASMARTLRIDPIDGLSDRAFGIVREIYGRSFGRAGSKPFTAAVEEFDRLTTEEPVR